MPDIKVTLAATPFQAAIDHFARKTRIPTEHYRDLSGEVHAKGFMIAGATNDTMLADFHTVLLDAQKNGTTLAAFRKNFDRIVAAHGWQYKGKRGWRSGVIFNTNMRTSLMAGKWERAQAVKSLIPYLRYVQVQRPSKRPGHAAWHGLVLPIDDPWWDTHYPPNGWGCLCSAHGVSQDMLAQEGWQVTKKPPTYPGDVPDEWAYNVGKAGRVAGPREHGDWEPVITSRDNTTYKRPAAVPLDTPKAKLGPKAADQQATYQAVRKMLGGAGRIFAGPDGVTVGITAKTLGYHLKIDRAPVVPLIPEMLTDPFEIWIMPMRDKKTGRIELRRRYIKAFSLGKGLYTWFVAELRKGEFSDVTMIRSNASKELTKQRKGILLYGKK